MKIVGEQLAQLEQLEQLEGLEVLIAATASSRRTEYVGKMPTLRFRIRAATQAIQGKQATQGKLTYKYSTDNPSYVIAD